VDAKTSTCAPAPPGSSRRHFGCEPLPPLPNRAECVKSERESEPMNAQA
jgi:hypothetical protein